MGNIKLLCKNFKNKAVYCGIEILLQMTKRARSAYMKIKKILNIVKNVVVWLIVVLAVFMMIFTIVSVNTFDRNDRSLFGYKAFIVMSDSMSKTDFDAGDLIFVKSVDPTTLKEGDIIAYISQNPSNYNETVTHKIRKLTTDANGDAGFITYGTTTDTDDETVVTYPYILGQYKGHIPNVGHFFNFLKSTPGYIVCILIPFLLLILIQGFNFVKTFRRYKLEQTAKMNEERAKLEAERAESQKMMEELMALKAQLASQQTEKKTTDADSENDTPQSDEKE